MVARRRKKTDTKKEVPEITDLALKYRPTKISEFVGNLNLKQTIATTISENKIPHCALFYGDFGCGKTTLARLFAKELGCATSFDLKEIDIAHFNGVDTIRDLRKHMGTKPMAGDAKVFILDEVHELSKPGQNALLKALEEPPKHVYFFLCTTDPQKVINTVRSRCVQYEVAPLTEKQIFSLTNTIAEKENIELPKKVGLQIARDSLGHPRNALKILEKIACLSADEMLEAAKQEAEKQEAVINLCRTLMKRTNWKTIAGILRKLTDDPEKMRRAVRGYFASVLLNGNEAGFIVLDVFKQPYFSTDGKNEFVRCVYEVFQELQD